MTQSEKIFFLKIYAEDGVFYEGECRELIIPCVDGEKAFLPGHEDVVYALYNGLLRFQVPAKPENTEDRSMNAFTSAKPVWIEAVVGKGVACFLDNECTVLAEAVERPDEIDEKRAKAAYERAQEMMQKELSMREYRISQMAMARATARIRALARKERE